MNISAKRIVEVIVLAQCLLTSCGKVVEDGDDAAAQSYNAGSLIGGWALNRNEMNYSYLLFGADSMATFSSRVDTVYRFRFMVKGQELVLEDIYGNKFNAQILKLDHDSLTLGSLLLNKGVQRYGRSNAWAQ